MLDVVGYHLSDAINPGFPWAISGSEKEFTLYDADGNKVHFPGIGNLALSDDYFRDYRQYNQNFNSPDIVALDSDFDIRTKHEYGSAFFNSTLGGETIGVTDKHWWLVNDFATPNVSIDEDAIGGESNGGSTPTDVNASVPLIASLGFLAIFLGRLRRRK